MDNKTLSTYVESLKSGNQNAFDTIYKETIQTINALTFSYLKNSNDASDIIQDTYLQAINKINTLKDSNAFRSWINTIAVNKCLRHLERKKKNVILSEEGQVIFENQVELDEELLPQEILDSKEKQKIIKNIIDSLPLEQKTAVYLYYYNELSLSEVAKQMNCSEGTVKSRLNYARKKIKVEVNSWEKKGTKLYGISGAPLLLLLLRNQLSEIQMPSDLSENIFSSLKTNISFDQLNNLKSSSKHINPSSNIASKSINTLLGFKSILTGIVTISLLGSGFYFYNINKSSNSTNYNEISLSLNELESKTNTMSANINPDIENLYTDSFSLYRDIKTGCNLGDELFNFQNISDNMKIDEDGSICGWTELNWSSTIIHSYKTLLENIIEIKTSIITKENITNEDKELIETTNNMLYYFINNQQVLEDLNSKFELLAYHDISSLKNDDVIYELNLQAQNLAKEDVQLYKEYLNTLNQLKNIMKIN